MSKDLNYYMSLPYRVEVVEDKEEGGYALHCPELSGCMTCADTIEQGFRMIEDAKREWFMACLERLPKSLHRLLAQRSDEEGVSMNQYCVYLLSKGIQ